MTIAAASFFTAATAPAVAATPPTTATATAAGFAEAFACAMTIVPDAVDAAAVPLPSSPGEVAPFPPPSPLYPQVVAAPVATPSVGAAPQPKPASRADPAAMTDAVAPTVDDMDRIATTFAEAPPADGDVVAAPDIPQPEVEAISTPSPEPAPSDEAAVRPFDDAVPAAPIAQVGATAPALVAVAAAAAAMGSPPQTAAGKVRTPLADAATNGVTDATGTTGSPAKSAATADAPRDAGPPTAAPVSGFGERLASVERSDAPSSPAPGATVSNAPQPAAARAADAPAAPPPPPPEPVVTARPGQIGREMGVEIAKRLGAGGEELTVRLNPVEMGRIEVRLSFDERGTLRAAVTAESAAALEMLRRDSADLGRALTDAGVRADAGSFRFDSQANGREGGQFWQRQQAANGRHRSSGPGDANAPADLQPAYRALRTSGRVDLVA